MPFRQRLRWPHRAWNSTAMRSPISNSSTSGPNATMIPTHSWPGLESLMEVDLPSNIESALKLMASSSVALFATASNSACASARPGSGASLSISFSAPGLRRTHAFPCSGTDSESEHFMPPARRHSMPASQFRRVGSPPLLVGQLRQVQTILPMSTSVLPDGFTRRTNPVDFAVGVLSWQTQT